MSRRRKWASALVAGLALLVAAPGVAAADEPKAELVRLQDQCDATTFNATFGPGFCSRTGTGVTVDEFTARLDPKDFGHRAWWINASGGRVGTTQLDQGDSLHVVNEGGILHTFTEVDRFKGGCIAAFSAPLGLTPIAADFADPAFGAICVPAFIQTGVAPGGSLDFTPSVGTHRFQCFFHPWMRQTVEVRRS